jgi:hypothetical protein
MPLVRLAEREREKINLIKNIEIIIAAPGF